MAQSPAVGMAFIGLFLLPFAVAGLGTAAAGLGRVAQGNWREGLLLLLFGAVFGGFAAAVAVAMVVGRKKLKELEQLRTRHPDQPWLWQPDWATGQIRDTSQRSLWASWFSAGFWNLIAFPVGFIGVREALLKGSHAGYVALLFPLIGVGLLGWAIRVSSRYLKYGTSRLDLSTIPGTIGRTIAGNVRLPASLPPDTAFDSTLSCIRRITSRSGKNSSTSERILWQEETQARGESVRDVAGAGIRIPIRFRIPADAIASDSSNSRDQVVWRLTVSASVPGVDYQSNFEVPVFRTSMGEEPDIKEEETSRKEQREKYDQYRQRPGSRITVTRSQRGTEIVFAAARNPGVAVGATVFTILWTGIIAALVSFEAPALFPIVFGVFDLLLLVGTLQLWLGVSRVVADRAVVSVAWGYIYPGRDRRIPTAQVTDISIKIGMQAGTAPYYDIVLVLKEGKRLVAGRSVRDKREAEWLALTLKDAIGLKADLGQAHEKSREVWSSPGS